MKHIVRALLLVLALASPVEAETLVVPTGGDLQAALNVAKAGDVITLPAGSVFSGLYIFPAKSGTVTLTSASVLPNRRIGPADASLLATISSPYAMAPVDLTDSSNWVLDGLRFLANPGGAGDIITVERGTNITFKRLLLDIPDPQEQKRFILGNGVNIALTQSYCAGVWRSGQDTQCFVAWNGAGPYTITDNYLEAAGENIMFGGADSSAPENIPSDILVENNHVTKRLLWKGFPRGVKNLFELKSAQRVVVKNNLFENNWADAQSGRAIVITTRNQDGNAPWSIVKDVVFEDNVVRNTTMGIIITGFDDERTSQQSTNITLRRNRVESSSWGLLLLNEIGTLKVYGNTFTGLTYISDEGRLTSMGRDVQYAVKDLTWADNILPGIHGPEASGVAALELYTESLTLTTPVETEPEPVPEPTPEPTPELELLKAKVAELEAKLNSITAYIQATPTGIKIAKLIQYLRAIQ